MLVDATAAAEDEAIAVEVAVEDSVLAVAVDAEASLEDTDVEEEVCEAVVEGIAETMLVLILVVVLVLLLDVVDEVELAALVKCNRLTLSSKQTPEEQGSLAQQPRKFPAEQTYHCFDPSQVVSSRRANVSFILKKAGPSSRGNIAANTINVQSVMRRYYPLERQYVNEVEARKSSRVDVKHWY